MTRATMRRILRRRLMEVAADNWADSDLDELLNAGALEAEKAVVAVQPNAFAAIARQDIVANQEFYEKVAGAWHETDVRVLNTATGRYESLGAPLEYVLNRERTAGLQGTEAESGLATRYSHYGNFYALHPIPDTSITNGLETLYVPSIQMANDSDLPGTLHLGLHMLVVAWAHRFAIGETSDKIDEVEALIQRFEQQIPLFYRQTGAALPGIVPALVKNYEAD